MTSWTTFRKIWLKPEVYPLIGAMGAAIGVCGFAIVNKTRDSIITWDKSKRANGHYFSTLDEYVPAGAVTKSGSARIFGAENAIYESKSVQPDTPLTFTIRVGEAPEPEEEPEAEPEPEPEPEAKAIPEPEPAPSQPLPPTPVLAVQSPPPIPAEAPAPSINDEPIEKVQAVLDEALKLTTTTPPPTSSAPSASI